MAVPSDNPTFEKSFKGHSKGVSCVHFSPDTKQIVSGAGDRFVMIWHFHEDKRTFRYVGHEGPVTWVRFSPSGGMVASASTDSTVRLWRPIIQSESCKIRSHSAAVRCVEFSHDGQQLVTASNDKTAKLFDVEQRKFIRSFAEHRHWVNCVSLNSDDRLLASASNDKSVKIWDTASGKCIRSHDDMSNEALSVAFQPSDQCVASSFSDGSIRLWDTRMHRLLQLYDCTKTSSLAFHPSGNHLLVGSQILDLFEGKTVYTITEHSESINSVNFSKNGDYFVCASDDQVLLWKTNFLPLDFSEIVNRMETPNKVSSIVRSQSQAKCRKVIKSTGSAKSDSETVKPLGTTEVAIQQLTSQLDVLVETVGVFEERLNQMEDRFDQILTLNHEILKNFTPRNTTN